MIGEPKILITLILWYIIKVRGCRREQSVYESQWYHTMVCIIVGLMKSYIQSNFIVMYVKVVHFTCSQMQSASYSACCHIHIFCLRIKAYRMLLYFSVSSHAEFSISKSILRRSLFIVIHNTI